MKYYGNVFRPPSEARSLIIQATIGCSHNKCTFCYMYKDEPFIIRDIDDVIADLEEDRDYFHFYERVFIADGDALIIPTDKLLKLINYINENMPNVKRISSYATAKDINLKTEEELKLLYDNGLRMLYIGFESGDEEILRDINKGLTTKDYIEAMEKVNKVGFESSITIIAGLGGTAKWEQNAVGTAELISKTKPKYVSYLTIRLYENASLYRDYASGKFEMPTAEQILFEMRKFLEHVDSEGTVFRSNHASNYVLLGGTLNRDREALIAQIDETLRRKNFRPGMMRGL
ncbi:Radical SAM superfamily protein [Peptoniphilus asaccharolyticus DSM 20463]|uniref:Radical SAM superfamily protein n=1 Tax=Peptoniphilus asaccharolyticus DSM 20463 TaxID=573058 RepID=A0A1W1VG61_PEPAS|nr:radical SAM protein [Peptoniphilus asaccharolyticus]MBL7575845.1 B12-binding domain-containing radical SAM protein [Peptoniphilus asaccharolyticus]SMB92335.1 Radical SAM superfamily protein [Peptoniphilus asaccharolyticus DSM 20463]